MVSLDVQAVVGERLEVEEASHLGEDDVEVASLPRESLP